MLFRRMLVRWCSLACLLLVVLAACGGESRVHRDDSGGAAGVGGGAGAAAGAGSGGEAARAGAGSTLPTKDGVPIGDCTELTPSEQVLAGCPEMQPSDGDPCDAEQAGKACRYGIETNAQAMSAYQATAICSQGAWHGPSAYQCSVTCHALTEVDTTTLDTTDCAARPRTDCYPIDLVPAAPLTAQMLMDWKLETLLHDCVTNLPYGKHVEVDFSDGCPSTVVSAVALEPSTLACLVSKLAGGRFDCAVELPCSTWLQDLI